jgi:GNAT superfamily N-acetyltransferase
MEQTHVAAAVETHLKSFPSFFLSSLGPRFLREFYQSFLADPLGVGVVAVDADNRLLGSAVGPLDPRGYFGRLVRRRWWAFALAGAQSALRNPAAVPRLMRALFYRGEPPVGKTRALLSSIAVDPSVQGQGVGSGLLQSWVAEVRARGGRGCFLTTDALGNDAVNHFYQRLGWSLESAYSTPQGRKMNRYVYDF